MNGLTQNYELAEADYIAGMKYKEIAEKYGVSINTVKSWKTRYRWSKDKKGVHTKHKKVCTQKNVGTQTYNTVAEEVEQVMSNPDLTDKQRLFCLHYIRCFSATKAYQKAYGCNYNVANAEGYKLLVKPCVREEIQKLKQNRLNREMLHESDIFQKYMDIAFADITDYVDFRQEEVQVMAMYGPVYEKNDDGEKVPVTKLVNTVHFKDSREVDGTIITEVKQGRDGASIKLADRMKALQWLSDHMDLATDEQRARISHIKAQTARLSGADNKKELEKLDKVLSEIKGVI